MLISAEAADTQDTWVTQWKLFPWSLPSLSILHKLKSSRTVLQSALGQEGVLDLQPSSENLKQDILILP